MKEIKLGYYSRMSEMVVELNIKIPTGPNAINLHSDDFNICFVYDFFSKKTIAVISYGVSIKREGSYLAIRMGLKKNEYLHRSTPIVTPFMTNMKQYTTLYVYKDIIQWVM